MNTNKKISIYTATTSVTLWYNNVLWFPINYICTLQQCCMVSCTLQQCCMKFNYICTSALHVMHANVCRLLDDLGIGNDLGIGG